MKKTYPVLSANGLAFAHARSKDIPGEVSGLYEVRRGGVLLFERDGTPIAVACANGDLGPWRGSGFFATVSRLEAGGPLYYSFSTTKQTEHRLGLHGMTYSQESAVARSLIDQARPLAPRWNKPREPVQALS